MYYKDDTHYFVMTAKKQSLLEKGVILHVSDQSPDLRSMYSVCVSLTKSDKKVCPSLASVSHSLSFSQPFIPFCVFFFFAQYRPNGLTRPAVFWNKRTTQAHLLRVWVLAVRGSFLSSADFHRRN